MGKSTKHKKARVADFAKAKLKLGKGKQVASNATNTSISSRSIALPSQSLAATKDVPTSRRNLTLPELLVQCRHYSVPVKKEALTEVQQLLEAHEGLLHQHLLAIISSLSHLISDPVPSLRSQCRGVLSYIFDQLPTESIVSVSQGLILFTISSLSSLDEGVRIDSLKVLDLLMEKIPEEIVRGWDGSVDLEERDEGAKGDLMDKGVGGKVVEGLLGVMRVRSAGMSVTQGGFTSAASSDLSPSSRLAVLTTLATFLRSALSPHASSSSTPPPWYLSTSFSTPRSYSTFLTSLTPSTSTPIAIPSSAEIEPPSLPIEPFSLAFDGPSSDLALELLGLVSPPPKPYATAANGSTALQPTLLSLLHPTLLSSFLDAAPSAFSPTTLLTSTSSSHGADPELQTIVAVVGVARELYWREFGGSEAENVGREKERESARKLLVGMLGHASAYFPFGGDDLRERSAESTTSLLSLNLTFASLVSLLVLSSPSPSSLALRKPKSLKQTKTKTRKLDEMEKKIEVTVLNVREWVVAALKGELTSTLHPLGLPLTAPAYAALEPTIWSLLNQAPSSAEDKQAAEELWEAVLEHFSKVGGGSEVKKLAFGFVQRVVLIQTDPSYINRFTIPDAPSPSSKMGQWVLSLPKYLWELGVKHVETTETVLTFLLTLAQQGPKSLFSSLLPSLPAPLTPFFHLTHPTRGAIPGSFCKLPEGVQGKALDLVRYLLEEVEEKEAKRLRGAVRKAVESKGVGEGIRGRWGRM
ncbi:hypothetical protein BCR35DRAFT_306649 [Leucosporidium creatinivorum]|uniref:Pre-rRNA-processing protein n=1 Tax=Leucosporidium creatinivorum TaxID=106004 RepID=A0A1Y2ESH4_9BASI|nr:hypothetical protein BCR35DRAFT_306649 [Leucosporidium creatinivorum]